MWIEWMISLPVSLITPSEPCVSYVKQWQRSARSLTITEHLEVDDSDVLFHVKQWQRAEHPILNSLSGRFTGALSKPSIWMWS
jgi:hypothetical protein